MNVPDSWRQWWDPLIHGEPWANRLALMALLLMVIGAVLTVWRGRWYARLMLLPPHDPQFKRNRERVERDAERELIELFWDLGDDER